MQKLTLTFQFLLAHSLIEDCQQTPNEAASPGSPEGWMNHTNKCSKSWLGISQYIYCDIYFTKDTAIVSGYSYFMFSALLFFIYMLDLS